MAHPTKSGDIYEDISNNYYRTQLPRISSKTDPEAARAYNKDGLRLEAEFKRDALTYCGIEDHPKANIAWDIAYSATDSKRELVDMLADLSELLK